MSVINLHYLMPNFWLIHILTRAVCKIRKFIIPVKIQLSATHVSIKWTLCEWAFKSKTFWQGLKGKINALEKLTKKLLILACR